MAEEGHKSYFIFSWKTICLTFRHVLTRFFVRGGNEDKNQIYYSTQKAKHERGQ